MPIYEYQCPSCNNIFEEWVKTANDEEEETCPKCGGLAHRMISNTAFILKGGGWYVTDYGYRKGVSEDGKAGSAGGAVKPEGASESSTASGSAASSGTSSTESGSDKSVASGASSSTSSPAPSAPAPMAATGS